jgi:hypothetical protein
MRFKYRVFNTCVVWPSETAAKYHNVCKSEAAGIKTSGMTNRASKYFSNEV